MERHTGRGDSYNHCTSPTTNVDPKAAKELKLKMTVVDLKTKSRRQTADRERLAYLLT
jgi:hypothetical protein